MSDYLLDKEIKDKQRKTAEELVKRHNLEIIGPKGGIFYIIDKETGENLAGYGYYKNALNRAEKIIYKRHEPKPSQLTDMQIENSNWIIIERGDNYQVQSRGHWHSRVGIYPTREKAERRVKTLTCRDIGRHLARLTLGEN